MHIEKCVSPISIRGDNSRLMGKFIEFYQETPLLSLLVHLIPLMNCGMFPTLRTVEHANETNLFETAHHAAPRNIFLKDKMEKSIPQQVLLIF